MSEAAVRVFDTPELLEMILLLLPNKDLYRIQAVSQGFQAAIKSSINLRRAM
jgi:hypothetical protein